MVSTNSLTHRFERGLLGFFGATLVVSPAAANWLDATILNVQADHVVKAIEYTTGIGLLIAWALAIWITAREPKTSWWGCFFEGVGVPGTIISAGSIFQVAF